MDFSEEGEKGGKYVEVKERETSKEFCFEGFTQYSSVLAFNHTVGHFILFLFRNPQKCLTPSHHHMMNV